MFTYFGDADLDGQVTTSDFTILSQNFNSAGVWAKGDFNYDGKINALDFNALATNYGSPALGALALGAPGLGSLVPEPVSIALLSIASLACARRRRR